MVELLAAAVLYLPWPSISCANDPRLQNGKYAAVYSPDTRTIVLSLNICGNLEQLQSNQSTVYYENIHAIFTLAHELAHAEGIADEHLADCRAETIWTGIARKIHIPLMKIRKVQSALFKLDFPRILHGESCVRQPYLRKKEVFN